MSKSTTTFVSFQKLASLGELAPVIMRLMMACNDFSVANDAFGNWSQERDRTRKDRQHNARTYFLRVQIAHVYEALSIVGEINRKPKLLAAVRQCDRRTQQSFDALVALLGSDVYSVMETIRNKAAFHYVPDFARASLNDLAIQFPDQLTTVRMGREALDWFFEAADLVMERTVVRRIFKIPFSADVREEADKMALRLQEISNTFGDFAGYFIKFHTGK
jgi:hypothetical protein